jgi:hypothetical protein
VRLLKAAVGPGLAVLSLGAALLCAATPLVAQGVSGAAIGGHVLGSNGEPLAEASVHVVNASDGERWATTTDARGRYFIEYLSVGGPYRMEVRAVGYEPVQRDSVRLALGQRLTADFVLTPAALQLEPITVVSTPDTRASIIRTGPAQTISQNTIGRLPVAGRDYTELALLSPQVTRSPNGGLSFTGQHDRFNSIQVDGAGNNDPFGCACSGHGTPGWAVGLSAFTPEAVKELQIVTAPFDVRYGNFAGGLVNAVTQSGTNTTTGAILGFFEGASLSGADTAGTRGAPFNREELGLTLGAPIVRDRVAFFLNASARRQIFSQLVPAPGVDTTNGADSVGVGIRYGTLIRFQNLLRGYGVEPGTFAAASNTAPTRNLFAKLSFQLAVNSRLEVSHNYGHGNDRQAAGDRSPGSYSLSSAGSDNPETINATRLAWTTSFGSRYANELKLSRVDDRRTCLPNSGFAAVIVTADAGSVAAGTPALCVGLETGSTTWQVTDNFGIAAGSHRLTVGTHSELINLVDNALLFPAGQWTFDDLDALEQGRASSYVRDPVTPNGPQVAFQVRQAGFYAQDQWVPAPRLTVIAGLRLDVPFVPTAPTRDSLSQTELGINTALTPSGNALWSPRLGLNFDASGHGTLVLRGGVGLFAGRPAYYWFRNVYSTTGARALRFDCEGDDVPAFTLDPAQQPNTCAQPAPPTRLINYFDPRFRFPRNLKLALGADLLLTKGLLGTVDLLYSRGVNTVHLVDINLEGPVGVAAGEGGRTMYGTVDPTSGDATIARRTARLRGVYEIRNGSGDRAFSASAQLTKHFGNGSELSAAYTYTDAKDQMSTDVDFSFDNASSTPVNGSLEHRDSRPSVWERPHKITVVGTADLPLGIHLGFTYIGTSGTPYTYVLQGDGNADGFGGPAVGAPNDVVYVPKDASDISLADPTEFEALDKLIGKESCLRTQQGRLLARNSCRNPWVNETTVRLSKRFRSVEVTADLFNLLNFVHGSWGLVRQTIAGDGHTVPLLELVGYDEANGRGVYGVLPVSRRQIDPDASRWRLQLGSTLFF